MLSPAARPCPQCGSSVAVEHHYCPACGFPVGTTSTGTDDKFVGKTLPGGYHILDLISVGGMGRVYRAEQSVLGRTVAVKIIHPHLLADENSAVRFMTEARAASQLNHPNSISVFDFGRTDDGQPYLVMEFLRGKDLARVAYEEGPLSFRRIVDVLTQVLAALSESHELGIVHRDLKPENVVLEPLRRGGDFVKVLDFGLAKLKADAQAPSVTSPGIVCGTPDYMAPEQGRGDPIDGRSDLYAVGVMLFQLLTGRLPFEADSPTQVVMMHLSIPVPDPRQVAPERAIPDSLVDVVRRAMAKNAAHRYQDAEEFSDGLKQALTASEGYASGERVSAPPFASPMSLSAPAGSLIPGPTVTCSSCQERVPLARFCLECGARLSVRPAPSEQPTPTGLPLPLYGRDDDLAWLEDRREKAKRAVVGVRLVGEPGMGKTRLLQDFLRHAESQGDRVAFTGPDPYGAEVGYWAVREAVSQLARLDPDDIANKRFAGANDDAREGLVKLFDSRAPAKGTAPVERRFLVAEALRWAVQVAADEVKAGAVVLAVDDLQRVDGGSRSAFADLLGDPPGCGVLVIGTHTPGFDSGWAADVASGRTLSGLPPPTVQRLLRPSRPGDLDRMLSDERGVSPMYVDQLLRYQLEGGTDPPARLGDLIALRVDTIEPNSRRVLQAVAVLGDRVDTASIALLLPKGHDLQAGIAKLMSAGMVEQSSSGVSCSHPLLRDIVLAGIPHAVRRELHGKALRVSEKGGAPIEVSAQHAYYAQDSFQALLLLEQAAERAAARGDTASEVLALRRGVEVARQEISRGELDDPLRAVLIFSRKLGASLTRAGNFADAEGVLREALDLAGPTSPDRARVLGALAHVAHGRRREQEAMGYIDQAIEAAKQSGSNDLVTALTDTRRAWAS